MLPGSSATKCGTSISVAAMCSGGISIASLSARASLRPAELAIALESSSGFLSGANPLPGECLESPAPDIMDSMRVPFSSRLFMRCRQMKNINALTAKAKTIPPTPTAMPITVPDDNPSPPAEPWSSFWATVVLEDDDGVGALFVIVLVPDVAVLFMVPAVAVAVAVDGAEYVDPGTVGSVARMLRSDSCQRTWRAKASSELSVVCTHLL